MNANYDATYEPTEDDITAYNLDCAKRDAAPHARQSYTPEFVASIRQSELDSLASIKSSTCAHYWIPLTAAERTGYYELASVRELDNARQCLKCGVWK